MNSQYQIDRKGASRLLKNSIRTVDRYIKSKKLSTQTRDGRIWLDKDEIIKFKKSKEILMIGLSTPDLSIDNSVDSGVDSIDTTAFKGGAKEGFVEVFEKKNKRKKEGQEEGIYRKLYGETKEELTEKQERLELANYRIGQLESQIKNSVPLLEYRRETHEKEKIQEELKKQVSDKENLIKRVYTELKYERLSKKIFLFVLLTLLALQPLWLLFLYK